MRIRELNRDENAAKKGRKAFQRARRKGTSFAVEGGFSLYRLETLVLTSQVIFEPTAV